MSLFGDDKCMWPCQKILAAEGTWWCNYVSEREGSEGK